ncbi:MAG: T9SS type A sorting domain-containing protein [Ignavibacteria bacterium]|nr:T9SS type A sorting domain-containing protein [Ignavibacteria bacterium]
MEFGISKLGFVSLKIFDVLGNEVSTLVNENKPAGRYEVTFNGADFPSGVYFVRMESGDFMDVKNGSDKINFNKQGTCSLLYLMLYVFLIFLTDLTGCNSSRSFLFLTDNRLTQIRLCISFNILKTRVSIRVYL